MIANVVLAKVIGLGHGEALRGAHGRAEAAEAALAHVNIKLGSVEALGRAVAGIAKALCGADRLYVDAVYRAYLGAFVTDDAVVNLIVQAVAAMVRHRQGLMRILRGKNSRVLLEVIGIFHAQWLAAFACLQHVAKGQFEPMRERAHGLFDIAPVAVIGTDMFLVLACHHEIIKILHTAVSTSSTRAAGVRYFQHKLINWSTRRRG